MDSDFGLVYDGPLLRDGTIDVRELGPALAAVGELVDEANSTLQLGLRSPAVVVKSPFRRGSFLSELRIVCDQLTDLFAGPEASAIANLMEILGLAGLFGLLHFIRRNRGRKPKKVVQIEQTTKVRIELEDGEQMEIEQDVWRLFNTRRIRQLVERIIAPLKRNGIDNLKVIHKNESVIDLDKTEARYFDVPLEHENETVAESEQRLMLISLSFKPGNKWRVSDGRNAFFVTISDEAFVERVQNNSEVFAKGDVLHARVVTRQWIDGGDLKSSTEIVRVLNHVRVRSGQMNLLDSHDAKQDAPNQAS